MIQRVGGVTAARGPVSKAFCVLLSLLMLGVWSVAGTPGTAGAAGPLPAPTGLAPNNTSAGPNPLLTWSGVTGAKYYKVTHPDQNGNARTDTVYATSFATTVDYPIGTVNWSVAAYDELNQPGASASASFNNTVSNAPTLTCPSSPVNFPVESPAFSWTAVKGVRNYTLSVSTTDTFTPGSTDVYKTQATSYTLTKGVPDNQRYWAKVSGTSYNNVNTPESADCDFLVVWSPGRTGANDAQPKLESPKSGATVRDVVLRWDPLGGAASYEVQISPNGDWTNNLYYDVITDSTTWSPAKTLNNGSYFWRVRGIDNAGNFSRWSDEGTQSAWLFTVSPLVAPAAVFPADGQTIQNPDLRFSWKPVPGAGAYELQWADNPSFSYANQGDEINHTCITTHVDWSPYDYVTPPGRFAGPGGNAACQANRRVQSPGFVDGTTVYWHVRSLDNYTQPELASPWTTSGFDTTNHRPSANRAFVSTWSTPRRFFFNSAVPTLLGPSAGSTVATPQMTWTRVSGASSYRVSYTVNEWPWDNDAKVCKPPTGAAQTRVANTSAISYTPSLVAYPRKPDTDRDADSDWDQCPISVSFTVQSIDYSGRMSPVPPARSFTWGGYSLTGLTTGSTLTLGATSTDPVSDQPVNPANGATVTEIPRFTWKPVANADHYELRWFDNPSGQIYTVMSDYNVGANQSSPLTESFTPTQPIVAAPGAWQVAAYVGSTEIAASPKRMLTVAPPAPVTITGLTTRSKPGAAGSCTVGGFTESDCTAWARGATIPSTPLITWQTDPKADSYRVFVALDPGFTNVQRVYVTEQNSIRPVEALPDNQAGQSYYVAVQAAVNNWRTGGQDVTGTVYGDYGAAVEPANVWSFRKQSAPVSGLKVLSPTSSVKSNSTSICDDSSAGVTTFSDAPTFCWNTSSTLPYTSGDGGNGQNQTGDVGAMSYHIQVSTTPDFSNIIDQAWVDQPSYTPYEWPKASNGGYSPGSTGAPTWRPDHKTYPDGPIYWRVQAVDATGNGLTYATSPKITKDTAKVELTQPANLGDVGGATPSLQWESKTFAARYQVQVARNSDTGFSNPNLAFNQYTDLTSITPANNNSLTDGTSLPTGGYAWRVRAVDGDGNSGAWSTVRTFTVKPDQANLTAPTNNGNLVSLAPLTFKWNPVAGAVRYRFQLSQTNPPSSGGLQFDTVSNAWSLDRSLNGGRWYWQVQTLDTQNQVLATSNVWSFQYDSTRPSVTNLTATGGAKQVRLTWTGVPSTSNPITGYQVQRYTSGSVTTPVETRTTTSSSYTWTGLAVNTTYWFTVTPSDAVGPGTTSNRVSAKTNPGNTNVQSFVISTYNDFLRRNPSTSELNSAVASLGSNPSAGARSNWLKQFAKSPTWVNAIVNQFYTDTLGRPGETAGVSYWSTQISSGKMSVATVAANFYASNEYFAGFGHNNLTTWVKDLYTKILSRDGNNDPQGVAYWVQMAQQKAKPNAYSGRVWVAYSFYQSQESREKRVTALYQQLLHRGTDPGGLAFWAGQILTKGDISLAVNLASSDEYYTNAHNRYPG